MPPGGSLRTNTKPNLSGGLQTAKHVSYSRCCCRVRTSGGHASCNVVCPFQTASSSGHPPQHRAHGSLTIADVDGSILLPLRLELCWIQVHRRSERVILCDRLLLFELGENRVGIACLVQGELGHSTPRSLVDLQRYPEVSDLLTALLAQDLWQ